MIILILKTGSILFLFYHIPPLPVLCLFLRYWGLNPALLTCLVGPLLLSYISSPLWLFSATVYQEDHVHSLVTPLFIQLVCVFFSLLEDSRILKPHKEVFETVCMLRVHAEQSQQDGEDCKCSPTDPHPPTHGASSTLHGLIGP